MVWAAVCHEFSRPLSVERVSLRPPGAGEVEIEVDACAICHSDISYAAGEWGGILPAIYGHEVAGRVRRVGSGAGDYAPGDRVIATLIRHCGACRYCSEGAEILCEGEFSDADPPIRLANGTPVHQGLRTAGFAELAVLHKSQLAPIPHDLPGDAASLIACGVITGYGAVFNTARLSPGMSAVVIGCGGVGLNAVQAASLSGADPVIALDLNPSKLAIARQFGASHAFDAADPATPETVMALTGGRGADAVLVTVGAARAIDGAHALLAPNGAVVVVGMPPSGAMSSFEPTTLAGSNQRILGSKMGETRLARDVPAIIAAWRAGAIRLEPLISGRFPLDRINDAMAAVMTGDARRNIIVFG